MTAVPTCIVGSNFAGRDLVVGDVHGCFRTLERALSEIEFDPTRDRLFGVGDLINRGPCSEDALVWLEERFDVATLGNHDRWVREVLRAKARGTHARGPGWTRRVGRADYARWSRAFGRMPLALTIETAHGPVGVIHAQAPDPVWDRTLELLATGSDDIVDVAVLGYAAEEEEARARARPVEGLRALVHGHWPVRDVETTLNRWNIDTGAGVAGLNRLSVLEVNAVRFRAWTFEVGGSG